MSELQDDQKNKLKDEFIALEAGCFCWKQHNKVLNKSLLKKYLVEALKNDNNNKYRYYEDLKEKDLDFSYVNAGAFAFVIRVKVKNFKNKENKFKDLVIRLEDELPFSYTFQPDKDSLKNIRTKKLKNVSRRLGRCKIKQFHAENGVVHDIIVEVSKYEEKGSLLTVIKNNDITNQRRDKYAVQMIKGIYNLVSEGVYHRDIKPDNFLVTKKGNVKVTDFGFAILNTEPNPKLDGTPIYMSPELLEQFLNKDKTKHFPLISLDKSDMWSLGISILEIYGYNPFLKVATEEELIIKIQEMPLFLNKELKDIPSDIKELLKKMLELDPEKRISFKTLNKEYKDLLEKYDPDSKKHNSEYIPINNESITPSVCITDINNKQLNNQSLNITPSLNITDINNNQNLNTSSNLEENVYFDLQTAPNENISTSTNNNNSLSNNICYDSHCNVPLPLPLPLPKKKKKKKNLTSTATPAPAPVDKKKKKKNLTITTRTLLTNKKNLTAARILLGKKKTKKVSFSLY